MKFFTGTHNTDPYDWTEEFTRIALVNGWHPAPSSRYFLAHLTEAAGRWATHSGYLKKNPLPSVEELSKALTERFGLDPRARARELRKKAQNRVQGRHEAVASYASDLQDLATRAGIPSDSLLDMFITGLRDDIRVHIDSGPRIENLHEAIDTARRREAALLDIGRSKRVSVAAVKHTSDSESEEETRQSTEILQPKTCACSATHPSAAITSELESLRATVAALQSSFSTISQVLAVSSQPAPPHRREPPGPCPVCRELGHWKSECPKRPYGSGFSDRARLDKRNVECHRCREKGHFASECPAPAPVPRSGNGQLRR